MESQDLDDWQLPLSQLPIDPDQLSTSRRCTRDKARPCEHHVQPRIKPSIPQFSLPVLQLKNKALVIVLELESKLFGSFLSYQMVFERCSENSTKE